METYTQERNTVKSYRSQKLTKVTEELLDKGIGYYLDGAGFTHKANPFDQIRAPKAMAWRRPDQGLDFGFTVKGSHKETGGSVAYFMHTIAYGKVQLQLNNVMVELMERSSHKSDIEFFKPFSSFFA